MTHRLKLLLALCAIAAFTASSPCQAPPNANAAKATRSHSPGDKQGAKASTAPSNDKLKWCRELQSVAGGASGLEPAMRSYVLTTAAGGIKQCDPAKVQSTLTDAFRATLAMANEDTRTQATLQFNALTSLSHVNEAATESLVGSALPDAQGRVLSELIDRAVTARKFDRALELLHRIPAEGFPYGAASKLMGALPPSRDADRLSIFRSALSADQAPATARGARFGDDFGDLIVQQWQHLPHDLTQDAIHEVLDKAKAADADPQNHFGFSFNSNGKQASFSKQYDFKLIQLLAVLRAVAPEEADRRISDSDSLKQAVADFPNGLPGPGTPPPPPPGAKLHQPTSGAGDQKRQVQFSMSSGEGADAVQLAAAAQQSAQQASQQRLDDIAKQVDDNPKQAIATALALPENDGENHPRAEALLRIARAAKVKHPTTSRDALEELAKLGKDDQPSNKPEATAHFSWADAVTLAADLKAPDLARKLLDRGLEQADKMKGKDAEGDDPNLALKAWWPSTNVAESMIAAAGKISPQEALTTAQQMQDQDWQLLSRLRLANDALGASKGEIRTEVRTKSGNQWTSMVDTD